MPPYSPGLARRVGVARSLAHPPAGPATGRTADTAPVMGPGLRRAYPVARTFPTTEMLEAVTCACSSARRAVAEFESTTMDAVMWMSAWSERLRAAPAWALTT